MWADRDVRRVVLARFISRIGGEAAFFVGIWGKAAFDLEATPGELAAVMAALGIASLIGASIAGVLVDRFDPRRVLIWGEIVFIPAALAMTLADSIPALVGTTFILGLVGTPVFTAISSFAPYLTDDENRLARINGAIEGASWAAFVAGPAAGALIAGSIGIDGIFVLDAATSLIAALLVIGVHIRQMEKPKERRRGFQELKDGFVYTYTHRRLRFYIWIGSAVWILFGTFSALEPLFYRDILGVEVETMGWVASLFGFGLIGGTLIAARLPERLRTARFLTMIVGLNALGVIGYVGTDRLQVVIVAGILWGVLIGIMAPLHRTLLQVNSPDELVGRIMSVSHVHSETGHLLPLAIAPSLAAAFGVQPTLLASGAVVLVIALLFWPAATGLDRTREVTVPRPGLPDPSDEPRSVGH
jgi:predicted MFS family arabinose efflux permease